MIRTEKYDSSLYAIARFLIPSLVGIFLFMLPITYNEQVTIPIAVLSNLVYGYLEAQLPIIMTVFICFTAVVSSVVHLTKPQFVIQNQFLNSLFYVSPLWLTTRIAGMFFAVMALLQVGPEWIWSENTAGLLLHGLLPILFSVFLFAGLLLPLLVDFGLLELFGALLTKVMRPVFNLPGRSSIDCITSWLGDGTVGVLLTSKQYEQGYYTKREAAVIATTFSVVSITFSLVVISQVNLAHLFVPYYLTIALAGMVAAIIIPRIPPLSRKPDTYIDNQPRTNAEAIPQGFTSFQWGLKQAIEKAEKNFNFGGFLQGGFKNVLDLWLGVIPIVMALGTTALIVAEYTPLFKWLGYPFIPLLQLMQVPQAVEASQTLIIGFADMFLPSVIGSTIESELTRFVVACVSVSQLIYMSEVGGLILGSKIPVSLKELFIIYLERTLITLPVIVLVAHIIF